MHTLVLLRHGESQWNLENRFTGWTDVDLTPKGIEEAKAAGSALKKEGFSFDKAYTSVLTRAIKTLHLSLEEMEQLWIPEVKDWRLNERHYGALQGLNKSETAEKYGEEQVKIWRRSYDVPPPSLTEDDPMYPGNDPRYLSVDQALLPLYETLETTSARVLPYWESELLPDILSGKKIFVVAHGNSLRALVKHLDGLSKEEVLELNIPTGVPLVYTLTEEGKKISSKYLLSEEELAARMASVAKQGSTTSHNAHG